MRVESDFVHQLSDRMISEKKIPFFHVAGTADWIVFPPETALLKVPQERKFVLSNAGHASVLFSKEVIEKVSKWLSLIQRL